MSNCVVGSCRLGLNHYKRPPLWKVKREQGRTHYQLNVVKFQNMLQYYGCPWPVCGLKCLGLVVFFLWTAEFFFLSAVSLRNVILYK